MTTYCLQSKYSSTVTLHGGPVRLPPVRATPCYSGVDALLTISSGVIGTTDIGAEYGDVRPLDPARMRSLSENGVQLLDLIDSNDAFVSELASPTVGVIT